MCRRKLELRRAVRQNRLIEDFDAPVLHSYEKREVVTRPHLLMFKGMIGIGKSALSRSIGKRLDWPVVDKDDFSDVLMTRVENYGPLAYESMFSVTESLLSQGFSVICDSPLRGEIGYLRAVKLAEQVSAELRIANCILSNETLWKTRLETRHRRPAHVIKTWADLTRYRQQASGDFNYSVAAPVLGVDMAVPLEQLTEKVITWLKNPEKGHDD